MKYAVVFASCKSGGHVFVACPLPGNQGFLVVNHKLAKNFLSVWFPGSYGRLQGISEANKVVGDIVRDSSLLAKEFG